MQKTLLTITALFLSINSICQTTQVFWIEDFNNNCSSNCLASIYTGINGAWSVTDVISPGSVANEWFVSCAENGEAVGNCGAACGNNATLHIGSVPCNLCLVCPNGDCGAAYNAGPAFGGQNPLTDKRAVSPLINTTGFSNITLSFKYIERGQNTNDNATVEYSIDSGITWNQFVNTAKTATTCGSGQGLWTAFADTLPASCNNINSLLLGFRWKNNSDGIGSDPSVAIDDVTLSVDVSALQQFNNSNNFSVIYNAATNQIEVTCNKEFKSAALIDANGKLVLERMITGNGNNYTCLLNTAKLSKGLYLLRVISATESATRKLIIN